MKLKRVHSVYAVVLMGCLAPFCRALASDDETTQRPQAQQQAKGTGRVSGHVYCTDTKAPARFATVTLQPVSTLGVKPSTQLDNSELPVSLKTGLEGAFTFPAVPPGDYLVLAWLPGYVSPLAQLTTNELHEETDPAAIKQKLTRFLGRLTVYRGQTSSIEISLERGVELSGTVTYDDGIPAAGMIMKLFRQQEGKGPWLEVLLNNSPTGSKLVRTDDRGHFRIAGVPAGKYVLSATFPAQYFDGEGVMTGSGISVLDRSTFGWLEIYSGNTLRVKDARPMEFVAGERRSDVDIVVPLSKLRHLSGIVIAQGDGHPLKIGVLYLLYADDMSLAQRAHIGQDPSLFDEDGKTFTFNFVIDGDYVLRAIASDGEEPSTEESTGRTKPVSKPTPRYRSVDVPIRVNGDNNDVIIALPEQRREGAAQLDQH